MKQEKFLSPAPTKANQKGADEVTTFLPAACYDYYLVYYDNTGAEVGRDFLYSDCSGHIDDVSGGGGGGGGGGDGGSGGGGDDGGDAGTGAMSPTAVVVVPPDKPINNIREFLKCFTTSQGATFTVYVKQPYPGRPDTWRGPIDDPDVGHTFISITQNGITRVLGFYPTSNKAIFDEGPGIMGDNSYHTYSESITIAISSDKLNNLLTYIYTNSSNTYNLPNYNCTDFGIGAAAAAGLTLPDTYGSWGMGGGSTPGTLGQNMRVLPLPAGATRTFSGTAPSKAGGC